MRLAWHSSGTYDAATGTGGSNGATMRFEPEISDPENAVAFFFSSKKKGKKTVFATFRFLNVFFVEGLDKARALLEPIKEKYPDISYSDLWILAAYVFLELSGGTIFVLPGKVKVLLL